ncbi:hypothetical protein GTP06_03880 [Lactococcus lactis]|uniref:hypothetical protein n=1 Tax=Lactococcus lactis TaxID=1358 RepID=UPI0013C6019D|nr:hypothetical protein [Lactococcus lactis]NEX57541.1 hypothetical protein [Lactococcus lactis]
MKFKTFDLRVYRHNDETLLSFDIKGEQIPFSKLLHIPKGSPFKMKITHKIAEKYRIKQEIKQTEYKGYVTEGVAQLADIIEEKIILMDYHTANKENWQDWMRVFVYEYLYDVAFNRGVRHERQRRKSKETVLSAFDIIGADDVIELSNELGVSEDKLTYAVLEVISKRKNGDKK